MIAIGGKSNLQTVCITQKKVMMKVARLGNNPSNEADNIAPPMIHNPIGSVLTPVWNLLLP